MNNLFNSYDLPCSDCSNEPLSRIPLRRILDTLDRDYAKNDLERALSHLQYWIKECKCLQDMRSELSLLNELIGLCRRLDDEMIALSALERAQELIGALHIENTVSAATIWLNMATTYKHFDKNEKALALYKSTEDAYISLLSPSAYEFAALYNNKSSALIALGWYEEAYQLLARALEILEGCDGEKIDSAITYCNLAQLFGVWRRDEGEIDRYLDAAWDVICAPDIVHDGKYAFVCAKSSETFKLFGKDELALALLEVAREIYEGA